MKYAIISIGLLLLIVVTFISSINFEIYTVSGLCIFLLINQFFWANSICNRDIPGDFFIKRTQVTIKERYLNIIGIIVVSLVYFLSLFLATSLFIFIVSVFSLWVVNSIVYNIRKPWVLAIAENLLYYNDGKIITNNIEDVTEILKSSLSDELIIKFTKSSNELCIPMYWFDKKELAIFLQQLQKCSSGIIRVSEELKKNYNFSTA